MLRRQTKLACFENQLYHSQHASLAVYGTFRDIHYWLRHAAAWKRNSLEKESTGFEPPDHRDTKQPPYHLCFLALILMLMNPSQGIQINTLQRFVAGSKASFLEGLLR